MRIRVTEHDIGTKRPAARYVENHLYRRRCQEHADNGLRNGHKKRNENALLPSVGRGTEPLKQIISAKASGA